MNNNYVAGFLFNLEVGKVLLIEKSHPDWQKGRLNAIGGHIEDGETPKQAMAREFDEECFILVPENAWEKFAILNGETSNGENWTVHFFKAFTTKNFDFSLDYNKESEVIQWFDLDLYSFNSNPIPNLQYLIPMALELGINNPADAFLITEIYKYNPGEFFV